MQHGLVRTALLTGLLVTSSASMAREPWLDSAWLVKVKPGGKRFIFSHGEARAGCREAEPCRTKAYVLAGDVLIASDFGTLGRQTTKWVEVEYVARSGRSTRGWLRDTDLQTLSDPPPTSIGAWMGRWVRTEATITMKPANRQGMVAVSGNATWGASDPGRARSGAVNTGEIDGRFQLKQSRGGFAIGAKGSLPFDQGDQSLCRVRFRLLSPYLLVEDNLNCGGLNVSFSGAYVKQAR